MSSLKIILAILLILTTSCSDLEKFLGIEKVPHKTSTPIDEGTPGERLKIDATINLISEIAARFGYSYRFDTIPILVTTENSFLTQRWGYCQWNERNEGIYIVINRNVFQEDELNPHLQYLFATLLHEIGHCYFARQHEQNLIEREGYFIDIIVPSTDNGFVLTETGFPVSIMYVGKSKMCIENCKIGLHPFAAIKEFENYFVAEIIGADKVKSFADLYRFSSLTWVPAR